MKDFILKDTTIDYFDLKEQLRLHFPTGELHNVVITDCIILNTPRRILDEMFKHEQKCLEGNLGSSYLGLEVFFCICKRRSVLGFRHADGVTLERIHFEEVPPEPKELEQL